VAGDPTEFETAYLGALREGRERDLGLGFSGQGPHRDDLTVEADGVDLRRFGSAGQIRAAMVVLKLGKLRLLQDRHGEAPVFLMDDFDTDLDETRSRDLAAFLHRGGCQAVVATSKDVLADRLGVPFKRVRMDGGAAEE
jgi:DNA replication and repair protein RecF